MYSLQRIARPTCIEEALELLSHKGSCILAGNHWQKLSSRKFDTGIDLSKIPGYTEISTGPRQELYVGAGLTYGELEEHPWVRRWYAGILSKALRGIVSKQLRNTAQIGASVASRFAFSDSLPVLLAAGAEIKLARVGWLSVEDFLALSARDLLGDIVVAIKLLPASNDQLSERICALGSYQALRITAQDFPLVCLALCLKIGSKRSAAHLCAGARPGLARHLLDLEEILNQHLAALQSGVSFESVTFGTQLAQLLRDKTLHHQLFEALANSTDFSGNTETPREYRISAAQRLLTDALLECAAQAEDLLEHTEPLETPTNQIAVSLDQASGVESNERHEACAMMTASHDQVAFAKTCQLGALCPGQEQVKTHTTINGEAYTISSPPDTTLMEALRELGLYSVKCGCETSNCGVCTVWVNERPVLSCSVLVSQLEGKEVTTLEDLQAEATAFGEYLAKEGGDQCGFCVPGMVMNALSLARRCKKRGTVASEQEIKEALLGNLCRCSGYQVHTRAIRSYINDLCN